jgi:hypothetical protein
MKPKAVDAKKLRDRLQQALTAGELLKAQAVEEDLASLVGWPTVLDIYRKSDELYFSLPKSRADTEANRLYLRLALEALK